jgi:DNA (cytosine-5)-methyltransferase 1
VRALSLFSGVGGFELGWRRVKGIETVMQVEQDKHCLAVLERHWPDVERATDVRNVGVVGTRKSKGVLDTTRDSLPADQRGRETWTGLPVGIDLVYGGFPCQDISVAKPGRRGLEGERSSLWYEFHRVLSELRPRWALIENVTGLLSSNSGHDLAIILAGLDEIGFDASWAVLDAQHFGVPQRRRRVFVVAGPRGRGPEQVLSVCESCDGTAQEGRPTEAQPAYTLTASVRGTGDGHGNAWNSNYITGPVPTRTDSVKPKRGRGADHDTFIPEGTRVRRLTPRECERLMGWPDDHTRWGADGSEISDPQRYKMCGNGVVAPVAEWLGHRLLAVNALMDRS